MKAVIVVWALIKKCIAFLAGLDSVLISVVGSVTLFGVFIFLLQLHITPVLPQTSHSIGVKKLNTNSIEVIAYHTDSVDLNNKLVKINQAVHADTIRLQREIDSLKMLSDPEVAVRKREAAIKKAKSKNEDAANQLRAKAFTVDNRTSYGLRVITFNTNPKLLLWIVTFALMVGVSFTLLINTADQIKKAKQYKLTFLQWTIDSLVAGLFLAGLIVTNLNGGSNKSFLPPFDIINDLQALFDQGVFFWIYSGEIIAFTVGSLALFGTLLLNSHLKNNGDVLITKDIFLRLKGDLDRYLVTFSILIVFSVLTISFLNQALIIHFVNIEKLQVIRSEFIYTYGFIFSSLLALIYIPINQKLNSMAAPDVFKDDAGKEKSAFYNNYLSLISILGPLVGSGVSEFIKTFE